MELRRPDLDWVWDAFADAELRLEEYLDDANRASDLVGLRDACRDYTEEMDATLRRMRDRMDDTWCWWD